MSLFNGTTPERRNADRVLPTIPNEIYLHIFDHVSLPAIPLFEERLTVFTNLSLVCRFFADICLPRTVEVIEFSGLMFQDPPDCDCAVTKSIRGAALCREIVAKQPLALALAKTVKECHFNDWKLDHNLLAAQRLKKYFAGISHVSNVQKFHFSNSTVSQKQWNPVAALGPLEELSFSNCNFESLSEPGDVKIEHWKKIQVAHLKVIGWSEYYIAMDAIDSHFLRALSTDFLFVQEVAWLLQSVTEFSCAWLERAENVHTVLTQVPQSLEVVNLSVQILDRGPDGHLEFWDILFDPEWKRLSSLRLVTLRFDIIDIPQVEWAAVFCSAVHIFKAVPNLQCLQVKEIGFPGIDLTMRHDDSEAGPAFLLTIENVGETTVLRLGD